jgi:hypothetical protein
MVGLPCLVSQCAKLHVSGCTWAVFASIYLDFCTWRLAILTMHKRNEQQVCIKRCANLGRCATENLTMMQQTFREQIVSFTQVFQWHARFKTGRTSVDNAEHTGRNTSCTTPETVARIQHLVHQDRRRTIQNITEEVGIGYVTCQRVLREEFVTHRVTTLVHSLLLWEPWRRMSGEGWKIFHLHSCSPVCIGNTIAR